ncbi:hypothetical protein HYE38_04120 [Mycoplasmopsis bovis]|nr:hypothetical protein HYE38_04120 [Mycoplasmopsis bovis]
MRLKHNRAKPKQRNKNNGRFRKRQGEQEKATKKKLKQLSKKLLLQKFQH